MTMKTALWYLLSVTVGGTKKKSFGALNEREKSNELTTYFFSFFNKALLIFLRADIYYQRDERGKKRNRLCEELCGFLVLVLSFLLYITFSYIFKKEGRNASVSPNNFLMNFCFPFFLDD